MKTNLSIKDENIYQVILQHLFDFSPFVQENQPFDFSKLVVYQPNKTVKINSYGEMFKYIFNPEYVGQSSSKVYKHGQFVVLDGDEKHVLHVTFPVGLECAMFASERTIRHYADIYYGFATCLVDNGV
jgi:hypothetical protein